MKKYRLLYLLIFVAAVVFSQVYKGHLSLTLLITVAVLPIISLILHLIAFFSVRLEADFSGEIYEKNREFKISVTAKNRFIIPVAPAVITVSLPDPSASADEAELVFALSPLQKKPLNLSYTLNYRGSYTFTLKKLRCYDMLKLFCFGRELNLTKEIVVLPDRIELAEGVGAGAEKECSLRGVNSSDGTELNFIRRYGDGDDFRRIHWKLSAKQDEYMVRQMMQPERIGMFLCCDFRAYSADAEENAANADRTAEAALAVILRCIRNDEETVCVWYSDKDKEHRSDVIADGVQFDRLFNDFARASVYSTGPSFDEVILSCMGWQNEGQSLCVVTPRVDEELEKMLERISAANRILLIVTAKGEKPPLKLLGYNKRVEVCALGGDIKESLEQISEQV